MHGKFIYPAIEKIPYTSLTPGNHDLGKDDVVSYLQANFSKYWGKRYVTSNVFYSETKNPLGNKVLRFKSQNGLNVLVFGIIFDFGNNANLSIIERVEDLVANNFFENELKNLDDIDLIFATGHFAHDQPEKDLIYKAIRKSAPNHPLIMLTGHSHVLFNDTLDSNGYIIESDHYFYKIGHLSFTINKSSKKIQDLSCTFVNTSKSEFIKLSKVKSSDFMVEEGIALRNDLYNRFKILGLDEVSGCSPATYLIQTYWDQPLSMDNLYLNRIIPEALLNSNDDIEYVSVFNMGFFRSGLYEGQVIEDDLLSIIPFVDNFRSCDNVKGSDLKVFLSKIVDMSPDLMLLNEIPALLREYHDRTVFNSRIKYFHLNHIEETKWSQWAKSLNYLNISDDKMYNLLGTDYDFLLFQKVLNSLFGNKYSGHPFNTTLTPKGILKKFVQTEFKCGSSIV
jgi:2',3'-cyclic-nucleotide 2'-phosphodiesterase (5'-nucleotidase family)